MDDKHIIIAYDIADNKRRGHLVRWLLNFAWRVQFSVFEAAISPKELERMLAGIKKRIDINEDSVLIYELNKSNLEKKQLLGIDKGEKDPMAEGYAVI